MTDNPIHADQEQLLSRGLAALQTPEEALKLLKDLCMPQELRALAQRFATAELLLLGFAYKEIIKAFRDADGKTISTATINRVNDMIKNGNGSYKEIIRRASGAEGY